ncbi:Rpn family recombination-promoting nuclease/putative transposase [uncultured Thiodictyon sp.]|jgi:hypothetical protein|uniref:Rpn family recombination-promoting nuclease/putative transposase n=1 Tax=uncultured Thiodictyon sp. TaxID=1846217 RepID=UPI0026006088|nr:Rpn family recombination-promoting nuclease/putative transposase [uncultured Thiodictyon sp.]
MDAITAPHDAFFRESFGRRDVALDFLRHHLPPELLTAMALIFVPASRSRGVRSQGFQP